MGSSDPCKIVISENTTLKLYTVRQTSPQTNLESGSMGVSLQIGKIKPFCDFKLSCHFKSGAHPLTDFHASWLGRRGSVQGDASGVKLIKSKY